MSNTFLQKRENYLSEIQKLIVESEQLLEETCSTLGWNLEETVTYDETFIVCPFNQGHRVPERTMTSHLEMCELNCLGYTKDCKLLPESSLAPGNPSSIKFDTSMQCNLLQEAKKNNLTANIGLNERLIPQTSERLTSDFTSDERKAMYEFVISNTLAPDIGEDITDLNKSNEFCAKSTPILELLAQERDLKRRRAKYRGVHTNKKSHVEIIREVIENQMEMYAEHLSKKHGFPVPNDADIKTCESSKEKRSESKKSKYEDKDRSSDSRRSKDHRSSHDSKNSDYRESKHVRDRRSSHYSKNSDYRESKHVGESKCERPDKKKYEKDKYSSSRKYRDESRSNSSSSRKHDYKSHSSDRKKSKR